MAKTSICYFRIRDFYSFATRFGFYLYESHVSELLDLIDGRPCLITLTVDGRDRRFFGDRELTRHGWPQS
jgi:hypothetical protein